MASSKVLPGCLASLLALGVGYCSWVALPSVRSEAEVKALLARQEQAHQQDQKQARDPQHNAFVDPELSPFWGRKSVEYRKDSKAAEIVAALRAYGFLGNEDEKGSQVGLLWKKKEGGLRTAAADFAAFLPILRKALGREIFVFPGSGLPDAETEMPNYLALRSIAQALSAYAEVQLADGHRAAALEAGLDILALARLSIGQKAHPLIMTVMASALQTTGQETISYLLQSSSDWSEAELRKLLEGLSSSPVTAPLLLESMEYELWVAQNTFRKPPGTLFGAAGRMPGVWQREWRLFQNDYYPYVQAARSGTALPVPQPAQGGLLGWVTGQHSSMAQLSMPNFQRVQALLEVSRQRQEFLRLYAELLLKKKQGKMPVSLSPEESRGLNFKSLRYRLEKGEPRLEYDLDSRLAQALPQAGRRQPGSARWENLMQAHWVLPVSP